MRKCDRSMPVIPVFILIDELKKHANNFNIAFTATETTDCGVKSWEYLLTRAGRM